MSIENVSTDVLIAEVRSRMTTDHERKLATFREELARLASCVTGPSFIRVFNLLLWEGPLDFFQIQILLRMKETPYSPAQIARVLSRLHKHGLVDKDDYGHWDISATAFRHLRVLAPAKS